MIVVLYSQDGQSDTLWSFINIAKERSTRFKHFEWENSLFRLVHMALFTGHVSLPEGIWIYLDHSDRHLNSSAQ